MRHRFFILLFFSLVLTLSAVVEARPNDRFHQDYTLKEVVILSRHNIRSPMSNNGSTLSKITPHQWFKWTSQPSELSLRGGVLETIMGQYFRKWLEDEEFIAENWQPKDGETRFYANSMQRTIATAQYFSSGMLPVANVKVEHKFAPSTMDPVFNPQLTYVGEPFRQEALKQINNFGGNRGLEGIGRDLQSSFDVLEKVLDLKDSPMGREEGLKHFRSDDLEIILNLNKEPAMKGSLKFANSASDALILQYYEESNPVKAAFGEKLSARQWEKVARVKDVYGDVLFSAPLVAVNVAHPLLKVMSEELAAPERKFTFLCGHDSNICSVLAALRAEDYSLPKTIEKKTPIGSKLVIEKWANKDGVEYARLNLVYQSTQQLRSCELLSLENPPLSFPIKLKGLKANADGLYLLSDLQSRFQESIEAYDRLP
ncbi:glucose-1-phosphatase [bacterium]|nr:glucose-1-phosphatase [bacterium]